MCVADGTNININCLWFVCINILTNLLLLIVLSDGSLVLFASPS